MRLNGNQRRRRWMLAGLSLTLGLAGTAWMVWQNRPAGPSYQGTSLRQLLRQGSRDQLEEALPKMGLEAIPWLIEALGEKDSLLDRAWSKVWPWLPLKVRSPRAKWWPVPSWEIREKAASGLRGFGTEAVAALPTLLAMASREEDASLRAYLPLVIAEVGRNSPAARKFFLEELRHTNRIHRSVMATVLYQTRFKLTEAVPLLLRDLPDHVDKPYGECLALSVMGSTAKSAVPLILAQMDDPEMHGNALTALAGIGTGLEPAIPVLVRMLLETEDRLRPKVVEVLMKIGPAARPALPALTAAQADTNPVVRMLACAAIGRILERPDLAVAGLMAEWKKQNSPHPAFGSPWSMVGNLEGAEALRAIAFNARQTAAWFLADLGSPAQRALPLLEEALNGPDPWLRPLAARAIYHITKQPDRALPALLNCLNSPDEEACFLATIALGEMGPEALPALPALEKVETRTLALRQAARHALSKIRRP
jgi:HEAT repeat protein